MAKGKERRLRREDGPADSTIVLSLYLVTTSFCIRIENEFAVRRLSSIKSVIACLTSIAEAVLDSALD